MKIISVNEMEHGDTVLLQSGRLFTVLDIKDYTFTADGFYWYTMARFVWSDEKAAWVEK